jgi:hypothetical protein
MFPCLRINGSVMPPGRTAAWSGGSPKNCRTLPMSPRPATSQSPIAGNWMTFTVPTPRAAVAAEMIANGPYRAPRAFAAIVPNVPHRPRFAVVAGQQQHAHPVASSEAANWISMTESLADEPVAARELRCRALSAYIRDIGTVVRLDHKGQTGPGRGGGLCGLARARTAGWRGSLELVRYGRSASRPA